MQLSLCTFPQFRNRPPPCVPIDAKPWSLYACRAYFRLLFGCCLFLSAVWWFFLFLIFFLVTICCRAPRRAFQSDRRVGLAAHGPSARLRHRTGQPSPRAAPGRRSRSDSLRGLLLRCVCHRPDCNALTWQKCNDCRPSPSAALASRGSHIRSDRAGTCPGSDPLYRPVWWDGRPSRRPGHFDAKRRQSRGGRWCPDTARCSSLLASPNADSFQSTRGKRDPVMAAGRSRICCLHCKSHSDICLPPVVRRRLRLSEVFLEECAARN